MLEASVSHSLREHALLLHFAPMTIKSRLLLFFSIGFGAAILPMLIFFFSDAAAFQSDAPAEKVPAGVAAAVAAAVAVWAIAIFAIFLSAKKIERPLRQMLAGIQNLSPGKPAPPFPKDLPKDIAPLNEALIAMAARFGNASIDLGTFLEHAVTAASGAERAFGEVEDGILAQSRIAAQTFEAVEKIGDGLSAASLELEKMADRISSSSAEITDVDNVIAQMAESVSGMTSFINEAGQSSKQSGDNVRALAGNIGELTAQVQTANLALNDMVGVAEKARSDATETAFIMGGLSQETERIGAAIEATIEGSDAIHASNERILEVTASLQSRVDRVDDVLDVVHNLAERTKLLSINASIIASEAGEHGRAFAVVAREVKELAQSTAAAIAEISVVLKGLKEGFSQTVKTIQSGQEDVDRGVSMARDAVVLLRTIPDKVRQASLLSDEIAARNSAQVKEGAEVKTIVNRLAAAMKQVSALLNEQISKNVNTLKLLESISHAAHLVLKSSGSHTQASGNVNRTVEDLSADFRAMAERVRGHVDGLDAATSLSKEVLGVADGNQKHIEAVAAVIRDLNNDLNQYMGMRQGRL